MKYAKRKNNLLVHNKNKSGCPVNHHTPDCSCNIRLSKIKKAQNKKFFFIDNPYKNHNYLNYV